MNILHSSAVILFLFISSCQNQEAQKTASKNGIDSSQISPSASGPVAQVRETARKTDTVPVRKNDFVLREVQAQTLDTSTKIGKPGDLLLTFIGQGFIFTEHNPSLVFGNVKYDNTYSNEDGSELYVIIPAADVSRFAAGIRDSIRIMNPGNQTASLKQDGKEIMSKASKAGSVGLIYTTYGVTRKKTER